VPLEGPSLTGPVVIPDLLRKGLETRPDEPALAAADARWTWRELDRAADRLAGNLLALGLSPGDRVASLMPNRVQLLLHYLACFRAGLVVTPLNYRYMAPEIDHALAVSDAAILLAHAERAADLAASRRAGRLPLGQIVYGGDVGGSRSFDRLLTQEPPSRRLAPPDPASPAVIFFTSGSTGPAKGVTHSHQTLGWMLAIYTRLFGFTGADILLPGSSLSHGAAFKTAFAALSAGARVDVARTFDADEILPLLRETRPTLVMMLPSALFALVRDHGAGREDFRSVRGFVSGGDKVSAELEREFTRLTGRQISEGYGMTEVGSIAANPLVGVNKLGSVGLTSPGVVVSIRDDAGAEVAAGRDGRLWLKSPGTTVGYWNNPAATDEVIRDGWFDSGDLMRADEDGYLWFRGRKKQIIVHDGSNIAPQEVEDAVLEHPAVAAAGVVGIRNPLHGENVRAYVTLRDGVARPTAQDLIQFARDRVGYKAPEEIVVLDAMPLNPTGKVDRTALKHMAAAHSGAQVIP
jgi:long-chain acyl-CoA synthetase